jgi:hypothetical protein
MLGDFIPSKPLPLITKDSIIDEYLEKKYARTIRTYNEELAKIEKTKITEKDTYNAYLSEQMTNIKTSRESGAKQYKATFPATHVRRDEAEFKDPLLELAINTLKNDLVTRGYTVTLLPYLECDQRDQGYYITGASMILTVTF